MNKKKNIKIGSVLGGLAVRIIMLLYAATVVVPLVWTLSTSFKTNKEFFADVWALPEKLMFENYEFAWSQMKISSYFLNSLFAVIVTLILTLIMTTTTAYIIAKFRYRWLRHVERFYLIVMTIPGVLILVPQYFMFLRMNWTNNLFTLSLLYALNSVPYSVFMQTGFMRSVDNALLEAAEIDGASEFQKFFHIVVPCVKASLFVAGLLNVMGTWNEYVLALTFLTDDRKYTVPIGLAQLQNASTYRVEYGGLFAGLVITMIPIIILYAIFQKPMQEGVKLEGGVKG